MSSGLSMSSTQAPSDAFDGLLGGFGGGTFSAPPPAAPPIDVEPEATALPSVGKSQHSVIFINISFCLLYKVKTVVLHTYKFLCTM